MREFIQGSESGVYVIDADMLPEHVLFIRDPALQTDEGMGPLLHTCEKGQAEGSSEYTILTGVVRWDTFHGYYYCQECRAIWDRDDKDGLRAIWSDGFGTGDEAQV